MHNHAGYRKVPSRNGGLKTVKCDCGWESQPAKAEERDSLFAAHLAEEMPPEVHEAGMSNFWRCLREELEG